MAVFWAMDSTGVTVYVKAVAQQTFTRQDERLGDMLIKMFTHPGYRHTLLPVDIGDQLVAHGLLVRSTKERAVGQYASGRRGEMLAYYTPSDSDWAKELVLCHCAR